MRFAYPLILLPAILTGCASSRYCERSEQVYEGVVEQAPLQPPEGLQVPPPDPNFAIPEATGEDVQYAVAVTDAKGRNRSRCLDAPPPLPAVSQPPESSEPEPGIETEPLPESPADAEPAPSES
jgi:uncharacterized lipoprotein